MVFSNIFAIKQNKNIFEKEIVKLLSSEEEFKVRVAIIMLMNYNLEKEKLNELCNYINNISNNGYYVHMAIAWIVSILYIKYPNETEIYLKTYKLKDITHNKAIQKIRESNQISKETKENLLKYKR